MGLLPKGYYSGTTALSLVLANILPLLGVWKLGWSVFDLVMFYWIETLVIGIFNAVKMALAQGDPPRSDKEAAQRMGPLFERIHDINEERERKEKGADYRPDNQFSNSHAPKGFLIPFFLFHYNFFIYVQFIFIITIFAPNELGGGFDLWASCQYVARNINYVGWAILGIVASHAYSLYIHYYLGGEYLENDPSIQMFKPYIRIFIQQFVVIFGSALAMMLQAPVVLLVILVALKTVVDLFAHRASHQATHTAE